MDFNIAEYEAIVDTVSASILKLIFQKFLPVEFCLIFRKKIQSYVAVWISFEYIMLKEINHSVKDILHDTTYMRCLKWSNIKKRAAW